MNVDRTQLEWHDRDFGNFKYDHKGESTVVTKLATKEGVRTEHQTLGGFKDEWDGWFTEIKPNLESGEQISGICAVLCGRVKPVIEGAQSPVHYLPLGQSVFVKLVQGFRLHPRITRTIGRQICYFSSQQHHRYQHGDWDGEEDIITCTARTSSQLEDDLALSSTFFPKTNLSVAVIYGCSKTQQDEALRQIAACDLASNHPMILPALLFELERARLVEAVDRLLDSFALKGSSDSDLDLDMDKARMTEFLKLTYEARELANQILSVMRQLNTMVAAMLAVEESMSSASSDRSTSGRVTFSSAVDDTSPRGEPGPNQRADETSIARLKLAGRQIRARLEDISNEFDDKINACHMVTDKHGPDDADGTVSNYFARQENKMNLKLSHVNTDLARTNTGLSHSMKRDSSQMRSIALLTMIFLPVSTVASIFSTTFFSWDAPDGQSVVSGYFWIFVVIAVVLTGVVVAAWYFATRIRHRAHVLHVDKESKLSLFNVRGGDEEQRIGFPGGHKQE
ncbi:hypothetical protein B0T22DRAFT_269755 [Podospora appendiculata]|uniref:Uncharacterized protein n=1 Tax=Podospora appendiculata TaxID=314037 RepID=A0AAE0X3X7_9PEZI|nr:hypothetical protein B0T22DRAFT_269755 [Podospora appendiculata]